ncbi:MAG TPA: GNAT family N-acetyltransferase [Planctomycetaceae bacterium]|jgi:GNAT superfamily N-acetyltransferase|nr:GNAT family N-acetyltransferase [Planctomycetaceae bacterium]
MLVTTTYLQMLSHPGRVVPPPRDGLLVMQAKHPTIAYYRFIYGEVGREWHWGRCNRLSDEELAKIIHDPLQEVHVLYVDGVPAGFAELDRRTPGDIELLQFGLIHDFLGQGLGKFFLQRMIDHAFSYSPKRFWLHTCTLDHPIALAHYQKAGFTIYKEETAERKI